MMVLVHGKNLLQWMNNILFFDEMVVVVVVIIVLRVVREDRIDIQEWLPCGMKAMTIQNPGTPNALCVMSRALGTEHVIMRL